MQHDATDIRKSDRFIPWYFVLFFLVIFIVDGAMVTVAIKTHTGTITEHPYEKGLAYNTVVDAENKQEELGWNGVISYHDKQISFVLRDKSGQEIKPDKATVALTRPTQAGMDFSVELKNSTANIDFPIKGLWEVRIYATKGKQHYQQAKRIVAE